MLQDPWFQTNSNNCNAIRLATESYNCQPGEFIFVGRAESISKTLQGYDTYSLQLSYHFLTIVWRIVILLVRLKHLTPEMIIIT